MTVTNVIMASDIRRLADLVTTGQFNQEYLVTSVQRIGKTWVVEDTYCGGPDDEHRRPSKIIHTLYCSAEGIVTNLTKQVYPRPMDLEKLQNQSLHRTQ